MIVDHSSEVSASAHLDESFCTNGCWFSKNNRKIAIRISIAPDHPSDSKDMSAATLWTIKSQVVDDMKMWKLVHSVDISLESGPNLRRVAFFGRSKAEGQLMVSQLVAILHH